MAIREKTSQSADFNDRLALFKYFLHVFSNKALQDFAHLNSVKYEGFYENGNTLFYRELETLLSSCSFSRGLISKVELKQYDDNICSHLRRISEKRGLIHLKYFQYLSLIFTEMYLDRFFNDKEQFVNDLNSFIKEPQHHIPVSPYNKTGMELYTADKLNKICFMCATGSGKTLIMHINILQFWHYNTQAKRHYHGMDINKTILLSPNEGMSLQHLEEFKLSNLSASLFQKDGNSLGFSKNDILVIDMNKLKEEGKVKTVSVDSFERNNLVLIDEAHRGIQGDVWFDYRNRLSAEGGFSFEYSATFKQALRSVTAAKKEEVTQLNEYGKSIIIDYSYKYFYEDGYGKDYRIYNLQADFNDVEQHNTYLTGCLLSFYQQVKLFSVNCTNYNIYGITNPLLVFVGNRVTTPVKRSSLDAGEKDLLTDIEEVLMFINNFAGNKKKTFERLKKVMNANTNIIDNKEKDIFLDNFCPLENLFGASYTPENIYNDILKIVFNAEMHSDTPRLYMVNIEAQGEIGLKIGGIGNYFGVINIGDTSNLMKQCDQKGIITTSDAFTTQSLFRKINENGSQINILIGSRKFTEGWNCYRVSTMGLINFAKGEGSQAIQLFGRGVRLHGYKGGLKRSAKTENKPGKPPEYLSYLETLTIFGIKADYMARFKEYLEIEGLPVNIQNFTYNMATVNRYDPSKKLKVLRVKEGINFTKQSKRFLLDAPEGEVGKYFSSRKITLDFRSKVQKIISSKDTESVVESDKTPRKIDLKYHKYIDFNYIYWQLINYKSEKKYYNICLDRALLPKILADDNFNYGIIIPEDELKIDSMEKLNKVTSFTALLLKTYMDRYYAYRKNEWESPYLTYQDLAPDDPDFVSEYVFSYKTENVEDTNYEELKNYIEELNNLLKTGKVDLLRDQRTRFANNYLITFDFPNHLFVPLVYKSDKLTTVQVTPVSLNDGEKQFINLLQHYIFNNSDILAGKDIFLLRNKSKAGIGFFEAGNFYPDFILWIDTKDKQYMTFIDPKGLVYHRENDPKIQFYKTIKELEKRPLLQQTKGSKDIILNSFIISGSDFNQTKNAWNLEKKEFADRHILFVEHFDCIKTMFTKLLG